LTFGVDGNVWGITHGASSSVPFPDYIWSFELPILILGVPFWFFAFATAWPLVAVTWRLAKRFEIRSFIYYALCGAVSGFVLTPVFLFLQPEMMWSEDTTFVEDFNRWASTLILCGICGALAFWYRTGRHLGRTLPNIAQPQSTH
jgi:hypothetical protein